MSNGAVPTPAQRFRIRFLPAIPGSNAAASAAAAAQSATAAQTAANQAVLATTGKVSKTGDTMTGFLVLSGDPTMALHAATKQYVDAGTGGFGNVHSFGAPVAAQLAQWTDATHIQGLTIGPTLTTAGGALNTTAGGGNVQNSGTPVSGQLAQWTGTNTIQGINSSSLGFQPLSTDLTSIANATSFGASGLYYRKSAGVWAPLNLSGLTLTPATDTLAATASGGNVSNSGTPTAGQIATWVDATHIQGTASSALGFLPTIGGTLTGDLTISETAPNFILSKVAGNAATIYGSTGANARWSFQLGDGTAESGSNAGSNFALQRFSDAGTLLGTPLSVARATGVATFSQIPISVTPATASNDTSVATTAFVKAAIAGGAAATVISDTPPPSPTNGQLWWQSNLGQLWISYTDVNSTQWVAAAAPSVATPTGVVQHVYTENTTNALTNNGSPGTPQQTEGLQILSATITPRSATNKLAFHFSTMWSENNVASVWFALFQDSTATAISAAFDTMHVAAQYKTVSFDYEMTAGTTAATTFKVRMAVVGGSGVSTVAINGQVGTLVGGGTQRAVLTVTELAS